MNDPSSAQFNPTHFGSGHNIFVSLKDSKDRDPRKQAADKLHWLWQRFVYPHGFGRARAILETSRVVFLDASPGSGRETAAQMLLFELDTSSDEIHQMFLQSPEEGSLIDLTHVRDGDRVWLDLAHEESPWNAVSLELSRLCEVVPQRSAHLVVILPYHAEGLDSLNHYRAEIERPSLNEVFLRHLRLAGFDPDLLLDEPELPEGARTLKKIPEFVDLIVRARANIPNAGDFGSWHRAAKDALSGWEKEVSGLVAKLEHGSQRALLLATAMLPGAHSEEIRQASTTLLKLAEHPDEERPLLEQPSLDKQFQEIEAELDTRHHARFKMLDYDSAVRTFAWAHLPDLRDPWTSWIAHIAGAPELEDQEREELVQRFARLCLAPQDQLRLGYLVEQWTSHSPSPSQLRTAAILLLNGLQEQAHGRFFRRQIYEWSRRSNLPDQLAGLLVVTCHDQMAVKHPNEAVVRLHHLARNEQGTHARETLVELVGQDHRLLLQMLQRISRSSTNLKPWKADAHLFLELADPAALVQTEVNGSPLLVLDPAPGQLGAGWRLVFTLLPHDSWSPLVWKWLELAAADGSHRQELLDVLVKGGAGNTRVLARLNWMTERRDLRPALKEQFFHRINKAQGLSAAGSREGRES